MSELDNIIVLNDEDGNEVQFAFLDLIEYEDNEYVVLLPTNGEDEVLILLVEPGDENSDEEVYTSVEDADTLQAVFEIVKEKFKDDFNFVD